jgi:hypothetical protein
MREGLRPGIIATGAASRGQVRWMNMIAPIELIRLTMERMINRKFGRATFKRQIRKVDFRY